MYLLVYHSYLIRYHMLCLFQQFQQCCSLIVVIYFLLLIMYFFQHTPASNIHHFTLGIYSFKFLQHI